MLEFTIRVLKWSFLFLENEKRTWEKQEMLQLDLGFKGNGELYFF